MSCLYAGTELSRICKKMLNPSFDSLAAEIIEGLDVAGSDKLMLQHLARCYAPSPVKLKYPLKHFHKH